MKKLLCLVGLLSMLSISSFAQTERGTWLVGVSGNGSYKSSDLTIASKLQVSPLLGYFFSKNLAIGVQSNLDNNTKFLNDMDVPYYKERNRGINGMFRYYIGDRNVKPYLNLMAGYSSYMVLVKGDSGFLVDAEYGKGMNASLGAGLAYFMSPKVALEAEANYQKYFYDDLDDSKISAVKLRMGIAFYLR